MFDGDDSMPWNAKERFPPYSGVDSSGVQGNIFSLLVG